MNRRSRVDDARRRFLGSGCTSSVKLEDLSALLADNLPANAFVARQGQRFAIDSDNFPADSSPSALAGLGCCSACVHGSPHRSSGSARCRVLACAFGCGKGGLPWGTRGSGGGPEDILGRFR